MNAGWRRRLTAPRTVAGLCAVGILLPTAVLFRLQYRSLELLRDRARLTAQEEVRTRLDLLRHRLERRVTSVGADSLRRFDEADLTAADLTSAAAKSQAILREYPDVARVFLVSDCACRGGPYAIVTDRAGTQRVRCDRFNGPVVSAALAGRRASRAVPTAGGDSDLLSYQDDSRPELYVSRSLTSTTRKPDGSAYAMIALDTAKLASAAVEDALDAPARRAGLLLAIDQAGNGIIYSSAPVRGGSQSIGVAGGAMFPLWVLSGRYTGATIESLARDQFRNGLLLFGAVLCSLVLALALALRAIAREAKLAEMKSTFVSNVSHEMKTPLALIRLFSETLELGRISDPAKKNEYYRLIHDESRRLTHLIDQVLDFSRIEAGRQKYVFAEADVAILVEDLLRTHEPRIVSAGFAFALEIERPVPTARIDVPAISQALLNLIDNALKYSRDRKELRVRVRRQGGEIAIEVADRGIGIPPSEHERIFEKFYRVSTGLVHDTKGGGLGLTLARHAIAAHGGRIEVESRPTQGSRFTIVLPAIEEPRPPARAVLRVSSASPR